MADQELLLAAVADFPRVLVEEHDVSDVLRGLVDRSTKVVGVAAGGISLLVGETLAFPTALDESIVSIERARVEAQRGPCIHAAHVGEPVVVADLAGFVERWPEVVAAATEVGVHAAAAVPMRHFGAVVGVLDLYDTEAREWSDDDLRAARLLADMATAYVIVNSRLQSAEHRSAQLQHALDSRVIIEQAKGMLAAEHQISVGEAFEVLRRHSRNHNVSVQEVAAELVRDRLRTRHRATRSSELSPEANQLRQWHPSVMSAR